MLSQAYVFREGALDVKYMQERFQRAKTWVQSFMHKHQRYMQLPLEQAHADLLQYERGADGGVGFLGFGLQLVHALTEAHDLSDGCLALALFKRFDFQL